MSDVRAIIVAVSVSIGVAALALVFALVSIRDNGYEGPVVPGVRANSGQPNHRHISECAPGRIVLDTDGSGWECVP